MPELSMKEFLEAGVHFGHQRGSWNPKMKEYIFGIRDNVHIIDLQKTVDLCKEACEFIKSITAQGKKVLFVGTKRQAQQIIAEQAKRANMFYITNRWLGGALTNFKTIRNGVNHLKKIEDMEEKGIFDALPKKEVTALKKERNKLLKVFSGIRDMKKLPGALFIIDPGKERIAVEEAKKLSIPIVAVVDTNCDPDGIRCVIPGNDDALKAIRLFATLIASSCLEGAQEFEKRLRDEGMQVEEAEEEKPVSAMDELSIPEKPVIIENPQEYDGQTVTSGTAADSADSEEQKQGSKNSKKKATSGGGESA